MPLKKLNLEYGPVWGWDDLTCDTVELPGTVLASVPYHAPFPLVEVSQGGLTIPSREELEVDFLLDRVPFPPAVSSLLGSVPHDDREFLLRACETHCPVVLTFRHVFNLPNEQRVVFVLEATPGDQPKLAPSLAFIRQRSKDAHAECEAAESAWKYASSIVRRTSPEERADHFRCFLSLHREVATTPGHPLNAIRRDLEDAVLHSHHSRYSLSCPKPERPAVRDFLALLPVGIVVKDCTKPIAEMLAEIASVCRDVQPPRDGAFVLFRHGVSDAPTRSILTWRPHSGEPPFPVIKAAACGQYPSILAATRSDRISPPVLRRSGADVSLDDDTPSVVEVRSLWSVAERDFGRFVDLPLPPGSPDDWARAGEAVAGDVRVQGTDALAWHQGFHHHTDNAWGIFFNAPRMDEFIQGVYAAMAIAMQGHRASFGVTAMAIVQWIAEHEWFHARVEAALTYAELTGGASRCLSYKTNVYRPLACLSDDCLEEALANFSAQQSLFNGRNRWSQLLSETERSSLAAALEKAMDDSPPGYRAWRRGWNVTSWRTLAWELLTGNPATGAARAIAPLEPLLLGPLPYDHREDDVPWYVYGDGIVMNAMLASPSTFSVPSRRELAKALRYLGYRCEESRGKGSHEMWFKQGGAGFPLPHRDPVGRKVFGDFLRHSGVGTKSRYMAEVRPRI